jgi:hypothetical protein
MIITTPYPDLVRFIHPEYPTVDEIPMDEGFMMVRDITYAEVKRLDRYRDYLIISEAHAKAEWNREEIVSFVLTKIKSRRKPKYLDMSDEQFIEAVKCLYACGVWPDEVEPEESIFALFQNLLSTKRIGIYFALIHDGLHPMQILLSLLTFVGRCYNEDMYGMHRNYVQVIKSAQRTVKKNFHGALDHFVQTNGLPDEQRVLRFILDLGERNAN